MSKVPRIIAFAAGVATLLAAGVVLALQAQADVPPYFPTRLTNVSDSRQVIVVVGKSRTSSYATAYTYQKGSDGVWRAKFAAMPARIGWAGWVLGSQRVQNTGTSPMGTYRITTSFGSKPNPGTKVPYRLVNGNDYWVGDKKDPRTYNLFQPYASAHRTWRISQAERLAAYPVQYEYAAVINFNRPAASSVTWNSTYSEYVTSRPVNTTRGSAILLHINGAGATAGCVSLARSNMIKVLNGSTRRRNHASSWHHWPTSVVSERARGEGLSAPEPWSGLGPDPGRPSLVGPTTGQQRRRGRAGKR